MNIFYDKHSAQANGSVLVRFWSRQRRSARLYSVLYFQRCLCRVGCYFSRPLGVSKVAGRSDGPQFFVDVTWRDGVQQSLTVWTDVRVEVNVEGALPKTSFQVRTDVVSHRYTIEVASLSPLIFHIDSIVIIHMTSRVQAYLQITLKPPGS